MKLNRLKISALAVLAAVMLCGCAKDSPSAAVSVPPNSGPALVDGDLEQSIQASGADLTAGAEVTMMADITLVGPTAHFSIGPQKPTGMRMQVVADGKGQELGEAPGPGVMDEYGYLADDYYAQLVVVDLDGDGTYEVLASIGNGEDALRTTVYRYESGRDEPFRAVGTIDGAARITVEAGGILYAPGSAADEHLRLRLEGDALVAVPVEEVMG
ncbi:hypothetical protein LJC60_07790 [Ruminococcaceae bacterium OttesenSCG-928-D13]|nr:hypothetical protein [Ruminococcaceae bacterium OttesenSCG-928-D13]